MSPSSAAAHQWAVVAPTLPAPMMLILARLIGGSLVGVSRHINATPSPAKGADSLPARRTPRGENWPLPSRLPIIWCIGESAMATFDDFSFPFDDFSGKGRLFPLPNLVLFPHVMQPLHVFEPRYRDLLEDALAGDRLIVMAVLAPGWEEDYEGRPKLYPMACLARITTHCRLADGTYNALVLGLRRVRLLRELAPARPFREAEIELCEDHYRGCPLTQQWALQQKFRDALMHILPMLLKPKNNWISCWATTHPWASLPTSSAICSTSTWPANNRSWPSWTCIVGRTCC